MLHHIKTGEEVQNAGVDSVALERLGPKNCEHARAGPQSPDDRASPQHTSHDR